MVDGADEREGPLEVVAGVAPESEAWVSPAGDAGGAAVPEPAPEDGANEVTWQATQPFLPVAGADAEKSDLDQTLPDARIRQLREQAEEEARMLRQVLGDRVGTPDRSQDELSQIVSRETVLRLLGERVTAAQPPALLSIWRHEVRMAHWRAFGGLDEWSTAVSRAWERTEQQLEGMFEQLERWLPDHPYAEEIINLAEDVHGPARWFRRFLLKSERSFSRWLQPVMESEEVVVDVVALTRYATDELEHAVPWFTLHRAILETEVQPDQAQLIELLGGVRAIAELIREAFGGRNKEVRVLGLASGASGGGRMELELARRLGKDWRLHMQATDPDTLTVLRSLAGARVAFRQAQARGELAAESTFEVSETRPFDLTAWEPGAFDLVVMVGGLHHLRMADQARCLAEALRVGRLVMVLEPLYGEEERMEAFCRPLVRAGEHEPAARAQLS
ncbi:MAG TPA: class I SAM-dependent methyltransferase, partial [Ktedonobacterales bacterium]